MQYLCVLITINLASYIATIYLSNTLTVEDYSQLTLALTVSSLIAVVSLLGRSEMMLRRISQSNYLVPIASIISSIILSIIIISSYTLIYKSELSYVILVTSLTIISIVVAYTSSILKFRSKTIQLALTQKSNNVYKLIIAAVCLSSTLNYQEISIYIMISMYFLYFAYHFLFTCKVNYQFLNFKMNFYDKEGIPFLINGVSFLFYFQASVFVFGYYSLDYELALYSLALLPISAYALVFNAYFNSLTQSKFYQLAAISNVNAILYLKKIIKYQFYITPFILLSYCFLVFFVSPEVFDLNKYPDLIEMMILLFPVILFKFFSSSLSIYMNLKENIRFKNFVCIGAGVIGLLVSIFAIKLWGISGALIATLLVELFILIGYLSSFLKQKITTKISE
ncbi:hypothetical protein APQ14_00835 [Vibrio toranzoniae]|uniref:Polysaccharide biosynthesis protein C-terminal domain-containing protein n=1 Tax=Vibrio toranzoniae TaxID=1194427 RepID=A0A120DHJ2_9VIBR|nr:hypothetical protein [Vibrio toranzoniae]KWU02525.1 hypothetical protein APQ14_00835 [Vibrio toranzoniae]SBS37135.1 Polysaccharide biosynthesis protein [Vibrio toranzoniae]